MYSQSKKNLIASVNRLKQDKKKFVEFIDHISDDASIDRDTWIQLEAIIKNNIFKADVIDKHLSNIISPNIKPACKETITILFGENFYPGTFNLGERISNPAFIAKKDRLRLREWVCYQIDSAIKKLKSTNHLDEEKINEIEDKEGLTLGDLVYLMLFLRPFGKERLMDLIPNQIYQDVFHKILAIFLWQNAYYFPYIEKSYNESVGRIAFAIIPKIQSLSLREQFQYMVASCGLGVDLKSVASAASFLDNQNIIWFDKGDKTEEERLKRIHHELAARAQMPFGIDCWDEFCDQVVTSRNKIWLAWFHDDYCETIFDLNFIQALLVSNINLSVVSIPRSGRYGNDSCYQDVASFVEKNELMPLKKLMSDGRFTICSQGPCWGAVNGLEFSEEAANFIIKSEAMVVKGARSHEMLQGIKKDAYFANMVCREFSESVMGFGADTGVSIFLKQLAGHPSFQGFKERHLRVEKAEETDKIAMLCPMTGLDYLCAIRSENYKQIVNRFNDDHIAANQHIKVMSDRKNLTIDQVILNGEI